MTSQLKPRRGASVGVGVPFLGILPRNSICLTTKWHFSIVSFNPAWRMHLKTAGMFGVRSVALLAAIPMLSTY